LAFVRFDLGQAVEHTAAEFEEGRSGAEHPPAFEGFSDKPQRAASWRGLSSSVGGRVTFMG